MRDVYPTNVPTLRQLLLHEIPHLGILFARPPMSKQQIAIDAHEEKKSQRKYIDETSEEKIMATLTSLRYVV
jgi:hypothetical protein